MIAGASSPCWACKFSRESAAEFTHLFVSKDDAAITMQSSLEGEAAPVFPAMEVHVVPLDNEDGAWRKE